MATVLSFLSGKKTYIVAFLTAVTAVAQALGYTIPDFVYGIEVAAGLGAIRVAISTAPTA